MTVAASKKIRALLAAAGYGKADVSVYNKSYSMGSTVYVTIKRAEIRLTEVEEISKAGERIDRDESGDILGGGNCFVDVRYGDGVLDEHAALINEQVAAGRRDFAGFSLYDRDPFTWQVIESMGDGTGRSGMNLDRKEPGDGLARILASAGWLSVLHDEPSADAVEQGPCPECGLVGAHEGICAGPEEAPLAPVVSIDTPLARANDVAAEMAAPIARALYSLDEGATGERLAARVVRAAERWQAAFPCPAADEPRLRALWLAVERLIAHDEAL